MAPTVSQQKKERLKAAQAKAVASIAQNMPLLMHGSGDVPPSDVDPATAQLLSALTVQYIGTLLDAALDSNHMLRDNGTASNPVPPPPFPRSRTPSLPPPHSSPSKTRKRQRASDEYWDEPLPQPKIRGQSSSSSRVSGQPSADNPDQWVGVSGVDLFEDSRARSAYVRDALSTQSFIFPICHDAYAYGRVTEVLNANRNMEPVLMDSVLMDLVQTEGKRKHATKKKQKGDTSDPEDEDQEENAEESDEEGPYWPGVGSVLPIP